MTYEYECLKCGKKFEVNQKMNDKSLEKHYDRYKIGGITENCNGKVRRIITGGTGIIFKGTGWTKPRTNAQKKVDIALKRAGIEDESSGYEVGE